MMVDNILIIKKFRSSFKISVLIKLFIYFILYILIIFLVYAFLVIKSSKNKLR